MNAGDLPGGVAEGGDGSVLQAMLRDYLTGNKEALFGEGCSFVKSRLIATLPLPPTIDAVMAMARSSVTAQEQVVGSPRFQCNK